MSSSRGLDGFEGTSGAERAESEAFGIALGFAAFLIWGLFPLYFVWLRPVPPLVTLAFRAVFTTVALIPLVLLRGKGAEIVATFRNPKLAFGLFVTMAATATSWGLFVWLVAINRTLYASLGNYVSPLANVLFGAIFLRERPSRATFVAAALATVGVSVFALGVGRLPWESVLVAVSFAVYSLLRKKLNVDSTTGLSVETLFAFPIGVGYVVWAGKYFDFNDGVGGGFGGASPFWAVDPYWLALLVGAGALTAIPMLLFGSAARRVKLSTLGLLQYLTPTGQFLCGAFLLDEPTTGLQWASFGFIWAALALFSVELYRAERKIWRESRRRRPLERADERERAERDETCVAAKTAAETR